MASRSGFVDFATFAALNAPEEERLMREAMDAAEKADADAKSKLIRASQDAEREGVAGNVTDISQVGSYSDYLQAKKASEKAWAAFNATGRGDFRRGALAKSLQQRAGIDTADENAAAALKAREEQEAGDVGRAVTSGANSRNQWAAYAKAKADADKARAEQDRDFAKGFYADVEKRWGEENSFEPFGTPGRRRSDQARLARMLATGAGEGDFTPRSELQKKGIYSQAWGTPTNYYGGGGKPLPKLDQYGRPIEE